MREPGKPLTTAQIVGSVTGLLLTLLLAALDQTVVGPALPKVVASLQGLERYAWVATAYLLCSTVMVPITGKLADLYGRKSLLLTAAVLFVGSSALCGWSGLLPLPLDGMNQLILARGLQGLGGGMIMALAFTVIGDLFEPSQRARYQGLFGAVWGLASLVGPVLGGWLTDQLSWRWVFLVNVPIGALALLVLAFYFRDVHVPTPSKKLDGLGVVLFILAVVPALVASSVWSMPGLQDLLVASCTLAVLALGAFLWWETRAPEPLMPYRLFRIPVFSITVASVGLVGVVMFGAVLYVPLFVQAVLGLSATASGVILTPMTLMMVLANVVTGQVVSRTGHYRRMALLGLAVALLGELLLARMDARTSAAAVTGNMMVLGLGLGVTMPLYPTLVQNSVPREDLGIATSLVTFFRSVGATLGATVWGGLVVSRLGGIDLSALMSGQVRVPPEAGEAFSVLYLAGAALMLPILLLNTRLPASVPVAPRPRLARGVPQRQERAS